MQDRTFTCVDGSTTFSFVRNTIMSNTIDFIVLTHRDSDGDICGTAKISTEQLDTFTVEYCNVASGCVFIKFHDMKIAVRANFGDIWDIHEILSKVCVM